MCYKLKEKIDTKHTSKVQKSNGNKKQKTSTHSIQMKPNDFHVVQLKGGEESRASTDSSSPDKEYIYINPNAERELYDKKGNLLASIYGSVGTEVQFTTEGIKYIMNEQIRAIAASNHNCLTSTDVLLYLAERHDETVKGDIRDDFHTIEKRKKGWKVHTENYRTLNLVTFDLLHCMENIENVEVQQQYLPNLYQTIHSDSFLTLITDYAGKDYYFAASYFIQNAAEYLFMSEEQKETFRANVSNCINEIQRRYEEMLQEETFCREESRKDAPDNDESNLFGYDCQGFAMKNNPFFYYQDKTASTDLDSRYSKVEGYNGHYFIWLTKDTNTLGGGVTVESCAGKGGKRRAVFSIRTQNTSMGEERELTVLDKKTITEGYKQVNNPAIKYDLNFIQYMLEQAKKVVSQQEIDKSNIKLINQLSKEMHISTLLAFYENNFDLYEQKNTKSPEAQCYLKVKEFLTNIFNFKGKNIVFF